ARDGNRHPLASAIVTFFRINATTDKLEFIDQTRTDNDGQYTLPSLSTDLAELIVTITKNGYSPNSIVVEPPFTDVPTAVLKRSRSGFEREIASVNRSEAARRFVYVGPLLQALPVPGLRSVDTFALLNPGVLPAPQAANNNAAGAASALGGTGQFSVNGLR